MRTGSGAECQFIPAVCAPGASQSGHGAGGITPLGPAEENKGCCRHLGLIVSKPTHITSEAGKVSSTRFPTLPLVRRGGAPLWCAEIEQWDHSRQHLEPRAVDRGT